MDMVERVARAMEAALRDDKTLIVYVGSTGGETVLVDGDVDFRLLARAAMQALREPTEEMLDVMHGEIEIEVNTLESRASILNDRVVYRAMIDAALTSSEG